MALRSSRRQQRHTGCMMIMMARTLRRQRQRKAKDSKAKPRRLRVQVMHEAPLVRRATPWRGSPGCGCVRFRRCGSRADLSTLYERADVSPSTLAIVLRTVPNLVEALAEVWQGAPANQISGGGRTAWQDLGRGYVELQRTRAWGEHHMFFVSLHIPQTYRRCRCTSVKSP